MVGLLFLSACVTYVLAKGLNPAVCFIATPDCSTAVATWILCIATTAAFIAAYDAAQKAGAALTVSREAYVLETQPVLGVSLCSKPDHTMPRVELFVVDGELQDGPASGKLAESYHGVLFDFENLGRSALIDLVVSVQLNGADAGEVRIGNIGAEKDAHVVLNFEWDALKRPAIRWITPARAGESELDWTPLPPLSVARNVEEPSETGTTVPDATTANVNNRKWRLTFIEAESVEKGDDGEPKAES